MQLLKLFYYSPKKKMLNNKFIISKFNQTCNNYEYFNQMKNLKGCISIQLYFKKYKRKIFKTNIINEVVKM